MKKTRHYSDIDLDFTPHILTGDLSMKYDEDSVRRSLRNIVLTNKYERLFHPEIYSGISELLFEHMSQIVSISLKTRLENLIAKYEPRAKALHIEVTPNYSEDRYDIEISFYVINNLKPVTTKLYLKRIR
jgi:phage baseplate assembly protein W